MMTIQDLLDLSKTIAAPLFAGKTYPWEALADIGDFILQLGPTLPAEEYEQRGENIWIARDAKILTAPISPVPASLTTARSCASAPSCAAMRSWAKTPSSAIPAS